MVRLRLRRVGRKNQPSYRIVAASKESPRDGKFLEIVGFYNPRTNPETVTFKEDLIYKWLKNGAQPSDAVDRIFKTHKVWDRYERFKSGEDLEVLLKEAAEAAEARIVSPKTRFSAPTSKPIAVEPAVEEVAAEETAVEEAVEEVVEEVKEAVEETVEEAAEVVEETAEEVVEEAAEVVEEVKEAVKEAADSVEEEVEEAVEEVAEVVEEVAEKVVEEVVEEVTEAAEEAAPEEEAASDEEKAE